MELEFGVTVIIEEVGVECMVVETNKDEALLDLCGERFWLPIHCITEKEAA